MLGHRWEKVAATIVGAPGAGEAPAPGSGPGMAAQAQREYVIEVRKPNGETLRTTVCATGMFVYPAGSPMHVEVNFKTGEARIDPRAMSKMAKEMLRNRPGAAAGITGGTTGPVSAIGPASTVTQSAHMIGPDGQEIPASAIQGEDISGLVHAMMSGDPAARQVAVDRIRQLKEQISQRAASAGSFSQVSQPIQYGQVSTPTSFGPPSAFDPFGEGTGEGPAEQRIAKLQQLLDKGILTESEFQAKRQQIVSEI